MQKEVYEFISKQAGDPIIERRTCAISGKEFPIFQSDKEFYEKISPSFETSQTIGDKLISEHPEYFSRKEGKLSVKMPYPTLCPEERQRRRLLFRNERRLYKRVCDLTQNPLISTYSSHSSYRVYDYEVWRSDQWDPLQYGQNYDPTKDFLGQFAILYHQVPLKHSFIQMSENSRYTNYILEGKSLYMTNNASVCEECMYSSNISYSDYVVDSLFVKKSKVVYDSVLIENAHSIFSSTNCENSSYLYFCTNCLNCHDCILCNNMSNAQYCIENKQYTKEEYRQQATQRIEHLYQNLPESKKGKHTAIQKSLEGTGNECCYGDMIYDSHDVQISFEVHDGERVKYTKRLLSSEDCMDINYWGIESSLGYELHNCGQRFHNLAFCSLCSLDVSNLFYCIECHNDCHYCFACIGLRNKSYCIFNKQYSKEQWHDLVPQIIGYMIISGIWGEFFHPSLSPFGYNETVAQEYYPLDREQALARGYKRQDETIDPQIPAGMKTICREEYDDVQRMALKNEPDVKDKIFICEVSGRPFKLIEQELIFYRKYRVPLPSKHPDIRHEERLARRPGRELFLRTCDKCGVEILSVYAKEENLEVLEGLEEKQYIYCESCYQREVYG